MFASKEFSGSAYAGLYFICNHENILFVTDFADFVYKGFIKSHDSAFALDVFNHDGAYGFIYHVMQSVNIIRFCITKSAHEREEIIVEYVLPCCR